MQEQDQLVVFRLVQNTPTSYTREDGTSISQPASRRVLSEFTVNEDGKMVRYRHIKRASSILKKDQDEAGEVYNYLNDDIWFLNGIVVLHPLRDVNTIEFLRKMPLNAKHPNSMRPRDTMPVFEEIIAGEEGVSELDRAMVEDAAVELVMSLQKKENGLFVYDESRLDFYAKIYDLPGDLSPSDKVIALRREAKQKPAMFIHTIEQAIQNIQSDIDAAVSLGIVKITETGVIMNGTVVLPFDKQLSKKEQLKRTVEFFGGQSNNESYRELINSFNEKKPTFALQE